MRYLTALALALLAVVGANKYGIILALGTAWVLDGLEITVASAVGPVLAEQDARRAAGIQGPPRRIRGAPGARRWTSSSSWPIRCWRSIRRPAARRSRHRDGLVPRRESDARRYSAMSPCSSSARDVFVETSRGSAVPEERAKSSRRQCSPRLPT